MLVCTMELGAGSKLKLTDSHKVEPELTGKSVMTS
jgi:hypothetical protein